MSLPVPLPLSTNVTPLGSAPDSLSDAVGNVAAEVVTVKVPGEPTAKLAEAALVIAGGQFTVSEKVWNASGVTPLLAVIANVYDLDDPAAGVPANVAVPLWLSTNVTPVGRAPCSV